MGRVRVTTVVAQKQEVLNFLRLCLSSYLSYPPCKSHLFRAALYYKLCAVWLYTAFFHIIS